MGKHTDKYFSKTILWLSENWMGKEEDYRQFGFEGLIVWIDKLRNGEANTIKEQLILLDMRMENERNQSLNPWENHSNILERLVENP